MSFIPLDNAQLPTPHSDATASIPTGGDTNSYNFIRSQH